MESESLDAEFKRAMKLISSIYGVPVERIDQLLTMERDYIKEESDGK